MKIGGRSGHNPLARGASALVDETTEDRKIFLASKKYLEKSHQFIDCYPGNMNDANIELMWGINKANSNNVELFYSVHLNKAYNSYDGAIGAEIWLHPVASTATKDKANSILKNLEKLGFINRGIKYSSELAELNSTTMEAMIIECFFCEATGDVNLYKKLGGDALGFSIANGIDSKVEKKVVNNPTIQNKEYHRNIIVYKDSTIDKSSAEFMAMVLNYRKEDAVAIPLSQFNKYRGGSVFAIGTANIKCNKELKGQGRNETAQNILEHLIIGCK